MKVYSSILELVGNTPLVRLSRFEKAVNSKANIYAKLEKFNPAGSIKDRVALNIIEMAEKDGLLKEGSTIIEPTSGNTGIGLALVAILKGYKVLLVMPENMSIERVKLFKAYGAEVVLTDKSLGMQGAIEKANQLKNEIKNSIVAGQFDNENNSQTHYKFTGPEIYNALDGNVHLFVAGVGTGGTITGVGKFLKEQNKETKVIAVEPFTSAVLSGESAGAHNLQGIGAGFIPKILDTTIIDDIIKVKNEEAYEYARLLGKSEGVLVGISAGASLFAVAKLAKREENKNKNIVTVLPDGAEKYLSTELFDI